MGLFSALLSLGGTALSAGLSAVNNKRAKQKQDAEFAREAVHYAAKAAEDPLATSHNQQLLNQYDRDSRKQVENAQGVAAITGATNDYTLAVQKAIAEGRSDLMSDMSAGASERADKYNEKEEEVRQAQSAAEQAYHQQRNEQYGNLAANAMTTFGSLADSAIGSGSDKNNKDKKATGQAQTD